MSRTTAVDPITTAVVHNTLLTTAKEMRDTIQRTSFSPVIYEDRDFACGLLDAEANTLAEAPGLTAFMGTLSPGIKKSFEERGWDDLATGGHLRHLDSGIHRFASGRHDALDAHLPRRPALRFRGQQGASHRRGRQRSLPDRLDGCLPGGTPHSAGQALSRRRARSDAGIDHQVELSCTRNHLGRHPLRKSPASAPVKRASSRLLDKYGFDTVYECDSGHLRPRRAHGARRDSQDAGRHLEWRRLFRQQRNRHRNSAQGRRVGDDRSRSRGNDLRFFRLGRATARSDERRR